MKVTTERRIVANLGRRIAELRVGRGLPQEQLAEKADLTPRYLQGIEAGAENPTVGTLIRLARVLAVPVGMLFDPPKDPEARRVRQYRKRAKRRPTTSRRTGSA